MEYILTCSTQISKKCNDGKSRSFLNYFLNGIKILQQKFPYDENFEDGFNKRTCISHEFLKNGCLYQKREKDRVRFVKFPVSSKVLEPFNIPLDLVINIKK